MSLLDIDLKNLKPPFLVHSDLFNTSGLINELFKKEDKKLEPTILHLKLLMNVFGKDNLIFPSFNYSFPKDKLFDLQRTPSDLGVLPNYIISNDFFKRTKTPIFSFLTNIPELLIHHNRPFSHGSVFDFLYKNDGAVIFYGAEISSCTYLHYVEDQYGPPLFRYEKQFSGLLVDNDAIEETNVEFHVRPLGIDFDYNWDQLFELLSSSNVVKRLGPAVFAVRCKDLSLVWGEYFSKDQFAILSKSTSHSVKNKVNEYGRRFVQSDFEVI